MWYKVKKIYQWSNLVRPNWWKPWANTIAYYPLTDDFNDHKWSWTLYNLTNNTVSGNSVILTTLSWVKCADIHWAYLSASFVMNTLPCTLVFWNKSKWTVSNSQRPFWLTFNDLWSWWWWGLHPEGTNQLRIRYWNNTDQKTEVSYTINTNRHLYCLTLASDGCHLYIDDGTTTFNPKNSLQNPSNSWSPFRIWANQAWQTGNSNWAYWYMWDVILENRVWSLDEFKNYYNSKKSNYGL